MDTLEGILQSFVIDIFNGRTILAFVIAIILALVVSRLIAFGIIKITQSIGDYSDRAKTPEGLIRFRRVETYLNVIISFMRFGVFAFALIVAWQYSNPNPDVVPFTIIGASTIFFVLAGATITPALRDITAGTLMILEKWYNVGDFITIDPYYEERGVVERMNLRSTRIRKLNGEIMWVNNQYIQRVSVTPKGVRTMAIDLFVNDIKKGEELIAHIKTIISVGPTMLAKPLDVAYKQKLADNIWQITIIGETAPGREWLLEKFAIDLMQEYDEKLHLKDKVLVYEPLVRYADPIAERRFKRAVHAKTESKKESTKKTRS